MAAIKDQEYRELMRLVTTRTNTERYGNDPVRVLELDTQIRTIQCRRDLVKLRDKANGLPADVRRDLSEYLAQQLGVAA